MITGLLRTERLYLRKMTLADSPYLFTIWSNPDVTKFMDIINFSNEHQAKEMIRLLNKLVSENKAVR